MGENYSVYVSDDELAEWIDDMSENVFDGDTSLFVKAVELMRKNHGNALEELRTGDDTEQFT